MSRGELPNLDQELSKVLRHAQKWQSVLAAALANRETGWHRLIVRVDKGAIKTVQLQHDEQAES